MAKRFFVFAILAFAAGPGAFAQAVTSADITGFYSYGIATDEQLYGITTEPGFFTDKKNAYSLGSNLQFKTTVDGNEIILKVATKGRTGSPYEELQLVPASGSAFALALDTLYGRFPVLGMGLDLPLELYVSAGKYVSSSALPGKVTRYGLEAATNMVKTGGLANAGLELSKTITADSQISDLGFAVVSGQFVSSAFFDEGVSVLYDSDGSMSVHGRVVNGQYAPQFFAQARGTNVVLPFGLLSAEAVWALNGAGINSGHSTGASALLNLSFMEGKFTVPIGLSGAYYEKNIDTLGASASTTTDALNGDLRTTDFRQTIRAGLGLGARYVVPYQMEAELSLGGSYAHIEHIYRTPLDLFGASIDGKLTLNSAYFIGAGGILGTLQDLVWQNRADVPAGTVDYSHAFAIARNYGWEAYLGVNIGLKGSVVLGVNNNKGLAMNYGLESMKEGEMKYRQPGTTAAEALYETFGVFLKASVKDVIASRRPYARGIAIATLVCFLLGCPLPDGSPSATPSPTPTPSPASSPSPSPSALPPVSGAPDPADKPDGWAGASGAPLNPGGYGASGANTYTATTRSEFLNALHCGGAATSDAPKIIYVSGMIDLCADASNQAIDGFGFIQGAGLSGTYPSYEAYRNAYAGSCATGVASTLAATRTTLYNAQRAVVIIAIGSNTSILGMGAGAGFKNGNLKVDGKTNVVIRNVSILDAFDYFTEWDPGENLFNSQYDNLSVTNDATYVWVDHCRLGDGDRLDSGLPTVMVGGVGKKWVCHDGLLDVTNGASRVTVSWNVIENHDKTMLIGSSDSRTADSGRLKVTIHHNSFANANQRLPRVRFGQVHVYDNSYSGVGSYSIGVGDNARVWSENNIFSSIGASIAPYDDAANQGYVWDVGSSNVNAAMLDSAALVGWDPAAAYVYAAEPAAGLAAALSAGAGVGKF